MTVYYIENNGYNGLLFSDGRRWFCITGEVDGIHIDRSTISDIVKNFQRNAVDLDTFNDFWYTHFRDICYSDDCYTPTTTEQALEEQDYYETIYEG